MEDPSPKSQSTTGVPGQAGCWVVATKLNAVPVSPVERSTDAAGRLRAATEITPSSCTSRRRPTPSSSRRIGHRWWAWVRLCSVEVAPSPRSPKGSWRVTCSHLRLRSPREAHGQRCDAQEAEAKPVQESERTVTVPPLPQVAPPA